MGTGNVCKNCSANPKLDKESQIVPIRIPYACKLMMQELMAMGIASRIEVKKQ
jgi:DNA-directed RNA polymerase, beta subunit/140 kD subunit